MDKKKPFIDELSDIDRDLSNSQEVNVNEKIDDYHFKDASGYGKQYDRRDELYANLLENYIEQSKDKADKNVGYKQKFFNIVMTVFCCMIFIPLLAILIVAIRGDNNITAVIALSSSAISILSAIIILPKIIAKHLFPTDEDKNMIDLVKSMQENDSGIRTNSKKED